MHYPLTDIHADFGINRPFRRQIAAKKIIYTDEQTDRRTDRQRDRRHHGQADGQTLRTTTIGSFFKKEKNTKKRIVL